jgi:uncharacterized membrane protein
MPARAKTDDPLIADADPTPPGDRSTAQLIADLPRLVVQLVHDEIDALKKEIGARLARAGVGIGLLAAAAFVGFFALAVFIAAAVLGLSTVLPGWLSAIIVFGGVLVIAVILVLAGARTLKKDRNGRNDSATPAPTNDGAHR